MIYQFLLQLRPVLYNFIYIYDSPIPATTPTNPLYNFIYIYDSPMPATTPTNPP